jgi:hypothetical protein
MHQDHQMGWPDAWLDPAVAHGTTQGLAHTLSSADHISCQTTLEMP